jgi:hypothetical protein
LSFTKRPLEPGAERNSKISLKMGVGQEPELTTMKDLKKKVQIMQYEAIMVIDIKKFRQGQVFS